MDSDRNITCGLCYITCFHHVTWAEPRIQPPASSLLGSSSSMVRSTIIVRASDALPLAASVDDEQVGFNSLHLSTLSISM